MDAQIENIYNARLPNFQLMLYIEGMMMKHEEEYKQDVAINDADDYQCYEEIENDEISADEGRIAHD